MSSLNDMISKFNARAQSHQDSQKLNPFSGSYCENNRLSPKLGEENYGRPIEGSKTEQRGIKARSHINKEILELCETINDLANYNTEMMKRDLVEHPETAEEVIDDGAVLVTFGELFEIYARINDKVVGLLLAAKKKGLVHFEKEMLFQRRDDDELIALMKPIQVIRQIMREVLTPSPIPFESTSDSSIPPTN